MTTLEQTLITTICGAIQKRQIITFFYSDTTKINNDWRTVEPYLIGLSKTNNYQLCAWFLPTEEQLLNGEEEGWRLYIISGISKISITGRIFQPYRPFYNPNDKRMKNILCHV